MKRIRTLIPALLIALALTGSAITDAAAAQSKNFTGVVNVNTASAAELMQLPGIGEAKAKAIIERRAATPFKEAAELMEIKGIGEKVFAKLRDHVSVGGTSSGSQVVKQTPGAPVRAGQ